MKLIDLIKTINDIDEELIIFQENLEDYSSDIILAYAEQGDNGIKNANNKEYHYLIEVFLAKEFIEEWIEGKGKAKNEAKIAKRLFEYAINDA